MRSKDPTSSMANSSGPLHRGMPLHPADPSVAPQPKAGGIAARAMAARQTNMPAYMEGLNPEQRLAVETINGPVLVLAGAGTGKTRVLTTRIAHILATGHATPGQILAVTFTNKAAREMKKRIGAYIGPDVEGMAWLGTFHAICVKILRRHSELVGLKSSFSILDTDDQLRLIKQIIRAEGLDDKRWTRKPLPGSWMAGRTVRRRLRRFPLEMRRALQMVWGVSCTRPIRNASPF